MEQRNSQSKWIIVYIYCEIIFLYLFLFFVIRDRVESIEIVQSELFEARKRLQNIVENIDVHADVRKRIVNTNDKEVIECKLSSPLIIVIHKRKFCL